MRTPVVGAMRSRGLGPVALVLMSVLDGDGRRELQVAGVSGPLGQEVPAASLEQISVGLRNNPPLSNDDHLKVQEAAAELLSAGLGPLQTRRMLRRWEPKERPETHELRARLAVLRARLSPGALSAVLRSVPQLLGQQPDELARRLDRIEGATGRPPERVARTAVTLFGFDDACLAERVEAVGRALPEVPTEVLLARAPQLLGMRPARLRDGFSELSALLETCGLDAAPLVACQPSLLGCRVQTRLAPKLHALRELTSADEWELLAAKHHTLARLLTCSERRIRRLEAVPRSALRARRPVSKLLMMSEADFKSYMIGATP